MPFIIGLVSFLLPVAATAGLKGNGGTEARQQRILKNRATVEANLGTLKSNLATTRENLKTIQEELDHLTKLEKDHLSLKENYEKARSSLISEMNKNTLALNELGYGLDGESQKRAPHAGAPAGNEDDAKQRLTWKTQADAQLQKVEKQLFELEKNLRDVRARLAPLQGQLDSWAGREKDYERRIEELNSKLSRLEAAQPASAPQ